MTWIQVHSHRQFNLVAPRPTDVVLADIARAISSVPRFNGHTVRPYPVAQHALAVSVELETRHAHDGPRMVDDAFVTPAVLALWGLHHDDDEAYLGDPTRPYMQAVAEVNEAAARAVRVIKRRVQQAIAEALGFPGWFAEHAGVKLADDAMLGAEARELLHGGPVDDWAGNLPLATNAALTVVRSTYSQSYAEELWLARHKALVARAADEADAAHAIRARMEAR